MSHKGVILRADDLEIGQHVAVLNAPPIEQMTAYGYVHQFPDYRQTGVPLRIVAINLPFFVTEFLLGSSAGCRIIHDIRVNEYCRLSPEYVDALLADQQQLKQQSGANGESPATSEPDGGTEPRSGPSEQRV